MLYRGLLSFGAAVIWQVLDAATRPRMFCRKIQNTHVVAHERNPDNAFLCFCRIFHPNKAVDLQKEND